MSLKNYVKNAIQALGTPVPKTNNSLELEAQRFLRYGNQNTPLIQNWSQVEMSDEDMYTGYAYAAITKRANRTSIIGRRFIATDANPTVMEQYKKAEKELLHPYLEVINKSKTFSKKRFWYEISTYLDLEGIYYLMAVRNSTTARDGSVKVGAVQKFVLLNPYEVRRVVNDKTGEVGGYVESHNGFYREIPKEMIIEIKQLNPFNNDLTYSVTDAAKESQFTMKQASDYTRQTINGNISSPGILTTEVLLEERVFQNFKERVTGHQKGEPIFGNGSGVINWQDMQVDLDKAALDKINEIQRSILFAVTGTSKTVLGIEESGTTRDTSETQDDNFTADAIIPRVEDIADALNLDYRQWYPEWEVNQFEITVENPLESDSATELIKVDIRTNEYALTQTLVNSGYEYKLAAQYACGEITLEQLGEPTLEPKQETPVAEIPAKTAPSGTTPAIPEAPTEENPVNEESLKGKTQNQISAGDYSDILSDIIPEDLGCIMVNLEPVEVLKHIQNASDDLADASDMDYSNVPGEDVPHVTLLYGLLENGNVWKDKVDSLLSDWILDTVEIDKVGYFNLGDKKAIVAHIKTTPELLDGHDRLTLLPHANSFSDYLPHMTLAYINNDADTKKWVDTLGAIYNGKILRTIGLNYGDKPEEKEKKKKVKSDESCSHNCSCNHSHNHAEGDLKGFKQEHGSLSQAGLILAENGLDADTRDIVAGQENALRIGIAKIEADVITDCVDKVNTNAFEEESDVITKADKKDRTTELEMLLIGYYTFLFPIYAKQLLAKRASEYGKNVPYENTPEVKAYIKNVAKKASESHIDTIIKDVLSASNLAYNTVAEDHLVQLVTEEVAKGTPAYVKLLPKDPTLDQINRAVRAGEFDSTKLYKMAHDMALEGASRNTIVSAIKKEYVSISTNRANTIARTETARAFNQSQFQADTQFLTNSGLINKAYKKLRSRSGTPCPYCQALINQPPIPFTKNFADLGSELSATITRENGSVVVKKMPVNYEAIESGGVHVNCQCEYVLVLEPEQI